PPGRASARSSHGRNRSASMAIGIVPSYVCQPDNWDLESGSVAAWGLDASKQLAAGQVVTAPVVKVYDTDAGGADHGHRGAAGGGRRPLLRRGGALRAEPAQPVPGAAAAGQPHALPAVTVSVSH